MLVNATLAQQIHLSAPSYKAPVCHCFICASCSVSAVVGSNGVPVAVRNTCLPLADHFLCKAGAWGVSRLSFKMYFNMQWALLILLLFCPHLVCILKLFCLLALCFKPSRLPCFTLFFYLGYLITCCSLNSPKSFCHLHPFVFPLSSSNPCLFYIDYFDCLK